MPAVPAAPTSMGTTRPVPRRDAMIIAAVANPYGIADRTPTSKSLKPVRSCTRSGTKKVSPKPAAKSTK